MVTAKERTIITCSLIGIAGILALSVVKLTLFSAPDQSSLLPPPTDTKEARKAAMDNRGLGKELYLGDSRFHSPSVPCAIVGSFAEATRLFEVEGRCTLLPTGTQVTPSRYEGGLAQVNILSGPYAGRVGFVSKYALIEPSESRSGSDTPLFPDTISP